MSLIKRMRRQRAVYWQRTAPDHYGTFGYAAPVEIACRWEDKIGEFRNDMGEKHASIANVYVDRVMSIGDKLMRGELESDTSEDPREEPDAYEIQAFEQIPDINAKETLLLAHL